MRLALSGLLLLILAALLLALLREPERAANSLSAPTQPSVAARDVARLETVANEAPRSEPVAPPVAAAHEAPAADGCRIRARFVDAQRGPLESVQVVNRGSPSAIATSDSDGVVRFAVSFGEKTPKRLRFEAVREGLTTASFQVEPTRGVEVDAGEIVLTPGVLVRGRVVDSHGAALPAARVEFQSKVVTGTSSRSTNLAGCDSEATGAFQHRVAPAALMEVRISLRGFRDKTTEPVDTTARTELDLGDIVLEPISADRLFEVLVLAPDGTPIPHANVQYYCTAERSTSSGEWSADEKGRVVEEFRKDATCSFAARAPEDRYGAVSLHGVKRPGPPIVLQLTPKTELVLRAHDADDRPLGHITATLVDATKVSLTLENVEAKTDLLEGRATVTCPGVAFRIQAQAEGFDQLELGPFEPGSTPREIELSFTRIPGVRGIVFKDGAPCAGATVALHEASAADERRSSDGFPARSSRSSIATSTSDADGRFSITLLQKGAFYLRASKTGFADGEDGPFEIDPAAGIAGLRVEITPGGAIEGVLRGDTGSPEAGIAVCASRGDGIVLGTRTNERGAYRFSNLMPGPWMVRACPASWSENSHSSSSSRGSDVEPNVFPWACSVTSGGTTHYDIDLSARARLVGKVLWNGRPLPKLDAVLQRLGDGLDRAGAVEGVFRLRGDDAGPYGLWFESEIAPGVHWNLSQKLTLAAGENPWDLPITTGRVKGSHPLGKKCKVVLFSGAGADGQHVTFETRGDGTFELDVPAGSWSVFDRESSPPGSQGKIDVLRAQESVVVWL